MFRAFQSQTGEGQQRVKCMHGSRLKVRWKSLEKIFDACIHDTHALCLIDRNKSKLLLIQHKKHSLIADEISNPCTSVAAPTPSSVRRSQWKCKKSLKNVPNKQSPDMYQMADCYR